METLIYLLVVVVLFVAAQLLVPKPKVEDARPATLGDFFFPVVDSSRPIPIVFGTVKLSGPNVVWYGDLRTEPLKDKIKNGGLFSGTKHVVTGFRYFLGMQFSLCRGELHPDVFQVWVGDKLAYDGPFPDNRVLINHDNFFGEPQAGGAGNLAGFMSAYRGTDDQPANAYLQPFQGGADTPRYVGTANVVWEGGLLGNSPFIQPWAFVVARIPNPLGLTDDGVVFAHLAQDVQVVPGTPPSIRSANPANAIYEVFTNQEWGRGLPASRIDERSFRDVGELLRVERNGMSCVIDRVQPIEDVLREILRQIDGVVVDNPITGKIELKVARANYVVGDLRELRKDTNLSNIEKFGRLTIANTVNQVRVNFVDGRTWLPQQASDQDMANAMLQGAVSPETGVNVGSTLRFPYVISPTLAKSLATRELRKTALPLARFIARVTRDLWDLQPFDVVAVTDADLKLDRMPMRVLQVAHEGPGDDGILLSLMQDAFAFKVADSGIPPQSGWFIDSSLMPFDRGLIDECPRAIARRSIDFSDIAPGALLYAAAKKKGGETGFKILHRENGSGDPFAQGGAVVGSAIVATLKSDLAVSPSLTSSITVTCDTAEDQAALVLAFQPVDPRDAGINLRNLVAIVGSVSPSFPFDNPAQGEYALVAGGAEAGSGLDVVLKDVYRGAFDTAQCGGTGLASGYSGGVAKVFALVNAGATDGFISVPGNSVDIDAKIVPFSSRGEAVADSIPQITITMFHRVNAPYAPGQIKLNGVEQDAVDVDLDAVYLTPPNWDTLAMEVDFVRRDFRTSDEVEAITVDAETLFADFPAANSTTYTVRMKKVGVIPTTFATQSGNGNHFAFLLVDALIAHAGAVPDELIIGIATEHVIGGATIAAFYEAGWKFTTTSFYDGKFVFGALDTNVESAIYTATSTGTHNFALASSMVGAVERKVNGGAYATLIASGATTGSVSLTAGDTLRVRHTSTTAGLKKILHMDFGASTIGFAALKH